MELVELDLPGPVLVRLDRHTDKRGEFVETYDRAAFAALGIEVEFVQDSWSLSTKRDTIRGLHFQAPPRAQAKLVRVTRGRLLDVVVDLRHGSPTFGGHVAIEMSDSDWVALLVPEGFAHGFCTLQDDTAVAYKMSDHFSPPHYMGVAWNDPDLGIQWPVPDDAAIISDGDRDRPRLKDLQPIFEVNP